MRDEDIERELKILPELKRLNSSVNTFCQQMKDKLEIKARQGFSGWSELENEDGIKASFRDHMHRIMEGHKYQYVDIANLAMMLHILEAQDDNIQRIKISKEARAREKRPTRKKNKA